MSEYLHVVLLVALLVLPVALAVMGQRAVIRNMDPKLRKLLSLTL